MAANRKLQKIIGCLLLIFILDIAQAQNEPNQMEAMASTLTNALKPENEQYYFPGGVRIKNNSIPVNFFVFDMIDTTQNWYPPEMSIGKSVKIKKSGIYHFAPIRFTISFSHIAVIKNGSIKTFSFLNCEEKGNTVDEVVEYIRGNFDFDEEIIDRIIRYRDHGTYFAIDPMTKVNCNEAH